MRQTLCPLLPTADELSRQQILGEVTKSQSMKIEYYSVISDLLDMHKNWKLNLTFGGFQVNRIAARKVVFNSLQSLLQITYFKYLQINSRKSRSARIFQQLNQMGFDNEWWNL